MYKTLVVLVLQYQYLLAMIPKHFLEFASTHSSFELIREHFSSREYSENGSQRQAYILAQRKCASAAHSTFDVIPSVPKADFATVCILATARDRLALFEDATWCVFLVKDEEFPIVSMTKIALARQNWQESVENTDAQLIGRFDVEPGVSPGNVNWITDKIQGHSNMQCLAYSEISMHNKWLKHLSFMERQDALVEIAKEEADPWFFSGLSRLANPRRTTEIVRYLYHEQLMTHLKRGQVYKYCCDTGGTSSICESVTFGGFSAALGRFCFFRSSEHTWPNDRLVLSFLQALQLKIGPRTFVAGVPKNSTVDANDDNDSDASVGSQRKLARHKRKHTFVVSDSEDDAESDSESELSVQKRSKIGDEIGDMYMTLDGWAVKITDGVYCWFMTPKDLAPEVAKQAKYDFYLTNYETINLDIHDKRVVKCSAEEARKIIQKVCPDSYYCDVTSCIAPFPDCITRGVFDKKGDASMYAILACLRDSYKVKVDFGGTAPTLSSRCNHAHLHLWKNALSAKGTLQDWHSVAPHDAKCGACGLTRTLTASVGDADNQLVLGNVCAQRAKILWRLFRYYHHFPWHVFACMFLLVVDELHELQKSTVKAYAGKFYFH